MADWEGRVLYRPKRIKAEILPYDEVDVASLVHELVQADPEDPLIVLYGGTSERPMYLWVTGFKRHQSPTQKEREKPSEIPSYSPGTIPVRSQDDSGSIPVPLITDVLITNTGCTDSLIPESKAEDEEESPSSEEISFDEKSSKKTNIPYDEIKDAWNALASKYDLSKIRSITAKRGSNIKARWEDPDWRENWQEALGKIPKSQFLLGKKPGNDWKADIDWFLKPDSVTKILEGKYDDNKSAIPEDISERGPDHDSCPVPG
tara:strand:- start:2036 stop:2818 length:783 start_codon:yes stop_codon:yes gene_type:complete